MIRSNCIAIFILGVLYLSSCATKKVSENIAYRPAVHTWEFEFMQKSNDYSLDQFVPGNRQQKIKIVKRGTEDELVNFRSDMLDSGMFILLETRKLF